MSRFYYPPMSFELTSATPLEPVREYSSVPAADDVCEDCHGTGEIERNIDGCDVMVECVMCRPQLQRRSPALFSRRPNFIDADDAYGFDVGVSAYGEI